MPLLLSWCCRRLGLWKSSALLLAADPREAYPRVSDGCDDPWSEILFSWGFSFFCEEFEIGMVFFTIWGFSRVPEGVMVCLELGWFAEACSCRKRLAFY